MAATQAVATQAVVSANPSAVLSVARPAVQRETADVAVVVTQADAATPVPWDDEPVVQPVAELA